MTGDLVSWVERRIDDDGLDAGVGLLVLAALEGDHELDQWLAGEGGPPGTPAPADPAAAVVEPAGAFLRSIRVEGFRGIGPEVTVDLSPAPGLTVIAGRNGSGKSSIAEALEVLLTGSTYRWKKKTSQWQEHWRNLHHDGPASVSVQVVEEGKGVTTVCSTWADGTTDVEDRTTWTQRKGEKREERLGSLGWERPLETFRPMLSYDELGGLLESGPSELYDALAQVLGVEQLTDALKRIQSRLKTLKAPGAAVGTDRKQLLAAARLLEGDERAARMATLLGHTSPDVAAVRAIATGVDVADQGPVAALRALGHLSAPDPAAVAEAAEKLRTAVSAMSAAGESVSRRRLARLEIRKQALRIHAEHGDMSCPVCAAGQLDEGWASTSRDLLAREEAEFATLNRVRHELETAREGVRRLLTRRPRELDRAPTDDLERAVAEAREAWDAWTAAPAGDLDLADHVELHLDEVTGALERLRSAATASLTGLDDAWGPLAAGIAGWCDRAQAWLTAKPQVDRLAAAEGWLKANDTRLKNQRIAPIADGARHAWSLLRQESNVELDELTLEGTATRRRVRITASVDGTDAGALAVMSQGELHALALALFLPRASMAESPFRFLILDDPIQAMDPAKVDGFVRLLAEIATTRQVVVLSHDDRLPAAIRRSRVDATLLEVARGHDSRVTVASAQDPATRYLCDARALVVDDGLPDATLRRTLPGLLRMAVESAARDRFFTVRLTGGQTLVETEQQWDGHRQTRERVSLAVYDEARSLDAWLRVPYRRLALGCVSSAMHQGLLPTTDPADAVRAVGRLVDDVREGAK